MKRHFLRIFMATVVAAMTSFCLTSCGGDEPDSPGGGDEPSGPSTVAVTGVGLNKSSLTLTEGDSETLVASVTPSNATNTKVNWTSSSSAVATVDGNGKVTAVKAGSATITATSVDGGKTASCAVTVTQKPVAVTGVKMNVSVLNLEVGAQAILQATVQPDNASNKNVTWSSSDKSVATVDQKGEVTGLKVGKTTITVKTEEGNKTATCEVNVVKATVTPTSVKIEPATLSVKVGATAQLTATVGPEGAPQDVSWTSSATSVATVDKNGKVTGVKAGTATITAKTTTGNKTATCKVTVTSSTVAVTGVTLNKSTTTIKVGGSETLVATVKPDNATNKKVTWSTSAGSVAKVDANTGEVTGVKAGTATITATTEDGKKTASCKVTVTANTVAVTGVSLEPTSLSLETGKTQTLKATVKPTNATNQKVTFKSSAPTIASVDASTGKVTALKAGTATITVTTDDGKKTATCKVTVTDGTVKVTTINILNPSNEKETFHWQYIDYQNYTYQLKAEVLPSNATNKKVTWKSSNTSAFTVDQNGKVTFKKESFNEYVTVTAQDGSGVSARIDFSINERTANSITLTSSGGTGNFQTRPNGTFKVTAKLTPAPFNNKVTWSLSSNASSYAKIESSTDLTCTIKGLKATTASNPVVLTATYKSLTGKETKTVSQQIGIQGSTNPITGISFNNYKYDSNLGYRYESVNVGENVTVYATITPSNADQSDIVWTMANSEYAKVVSYSGRACTVKGIKKGNIQLICRDKGSGNSATLAIKVN